MWSGGSETGIQQSHHSHDNDDMNNDSDESNTHYAYDHNYDPGSDGSSDSQPGSQQQEEKEAANPRSHVRVVVRVRPPPPIRQPVTRPPLTIVKPSATTDNDAPLLLTSHTSLTIKNRTFGFDACFDDHTSQQALYQQAVGNSVGANIFRGYNTTVLAYGQTGSGKTYTMGPNPTTAAAATTTTTSSNNDSTNDGGVVVQAIRDLFAARTDNQDEWNVRITLTCLELFCEELRDLLLVVGNNNNTHTTNESSSSSGNHNNNNHLRLRNLGDTVTVEGATEIDVYDERQALELVHAAARRRATASTRMNERSSRSHAIYAFSVTMEPKKEPDQNDDCLLEVVKAKLTLVDLAGSEQIKKSGVRGAQRDESININMDLFALGKVVSALADRSSNPSSQQLHVPYRDSKLTQLLQDSLGGNCYTLLIACVSPLPDHTEETVNTLHYAERSRSIANVVSKNALRKVILTPAAFTALRVTNHRLQEELVSTQAAHTYMRVQCRHLENQLATVQQQLQNHESQVDADRRQLRNQVGTLTNKVCTLQAALNRAHGALAVAEEKRRLDQNRHEAAVAAWHNRDAKTAARVTEQERLVQQRDATIRLLEGRCSEQEKELVRREHQHHQHGQVEALPSWSDMQARDRLLQDQSDRIAQLEGMLETHEADRVRLEMVNNDRIGQLEAQVARYQEQHEEFLKKEEERDTAPAFDSPTPRTRSTMTSRSTTEAARRVIKSSSSSDGKENLATKKKKKQGRTLITTNSPTSVLDVQQPISPSSQEDNSTIPSSASWKRRAANKDADFFLPAINIRCEFGQSEVVEIPEGPGRTSLPAILRPWQCDFLTDAGITTTMDFINHTRGHNRRNELASYLREWRNERGLTVMRNESCVVALYIWRRACKAVLEAVAKTETEGQHLWGLGLIASDSLEVS